MIFIGVACIHRLHFGWYCRSASPLHSDSLLKQRRSVQYDMNRLLWLQVLAYSFNPVKSIPTTGSFPTAHALCPGGITADIAWTEFFLFAVVHYHLNSTRNNVPEYAAPGELSVFHNGFDTFFQLQPG